MIIDQVSRIEKEELQEAGTAQYPLIFPSVFQGGSVASLRWYLLIWLDEKNQI